MPLWGIQKDSRIKVSAFGLKTGRKPKAGAYEETRQGSTEPEPTDAKREHRLAVALVQMVTQEKS